MEEDLDNRIIQAMVHSRFTEPPQEFLPKGELDNLVTYDTIKERLLAEAGTDEEVSPDLVDFIYLRAKKVFATTMLCGVNVLEAMEGFMKHDFDDADLPIACPRTNSGNFCKPIAFSGRAWQKLKHIQGFWKYQESFLAPDFSTDKLQYTLSASAILPITWRETSKDRMKAGTFGTVFKALIHPNHHSPLFNLDGSPAQVAIKEINTDDDEVQKEIERTWETELTALADIKERRHEHMVSFVAAVKKGDMRYFILKWADGGNLCEFWATYKWQGIEISLVKDTVVELDGLADAIMTLHYFHSANNGYRHGDLKPENILRCRRPENPEGLGLLQIADMGLAKRHTFATRHRADGTSTKFGTVRYEPPESLWSLRPRSRLYDLWSMGGILLEHLVWLLYGPAELERFHAHIRGPRKQDEPMFELTTGQTPTSRSLIIRPAVSMWMDHMERDPECRKGVTVCGDLLNLVRMKLLVIPLSKRHQTGLNATTTRQGQEDGVINVLGDPAEIDEPIGTNYRADAKEFSVEMQRILAKVEASDDGTYLYTGLPRTNRRGPSDEACYAQRLLFVQAGSSGQITVPDVWLEVPKEKEANLVG